MPPIASPPEAIAAPARAMREARASCEASVAHCAARRAAKPRSAARGLAQLRGPRAVHVTSRSAARRRALRELCCAAPRAATPRSGQRAFFCSFPTQLPRGKVSFLTLIGVVSDTFYEVLNMY